MLKAKLQVEYDKLLKTYEGLDRAADLMILSNKELRAELVEVKGRNVALEESEHAIRCVRLPHVELENEQLKDQVSKLLKRVRRDDIAYKDLASTFQTFVQRTQSEEYIWSMRDPKEPRKEW